METCFLILKVSFIFLNSLHICFYPELYLPGLRITKSVFGDELSSFTKPQLINSISMPPLFKSVKQLLLAGKPRLSVQLCLICLIEGLNFSAV